MTEQERAEFIESIIDDILFLREEASKNENQDCISGVQNSRRTG